MLEVKNIEKYYGSRNNVTKALDRVSFRVEDGEFTPSWEPPAAARPLC